MLPMPRGCTRPSIGKPRARWRALTRALRRNLLRALAPPYHWGGAGVGDSVASVNVTLFSSHDLRPRPLARPGQSQLADW